jgi:hypothetical protein
VTVFDAEKWSLRIFNDHDAFQHLQSISTEPGTLEYYLDTCEANFGTSTGIAEHSVRIRMSDERRKKRWPS